MKTCGYCGRGNEEILTSCSECGTELPELKTTEANDSQESPTESSEIKLDELPGAYNFNEGFSRPDWEVIQKAIDAVQNEESRHRAWDDVILQWAKKLASELGGNYQVTTSERCVFVSDLELAARNRLRNFTTTDIDKIRETLPGLAWKNFDCLHLILLFEEEDDYYQYLSDFYPDGEHPITAGIQIHSGYPHIACLYHKETSTAQIISHELVHHSIDHLSVPRWLHEGLAITIERMMHSQRGQMLSDDLPERHHRFWNEKTIQGFWAGTSFGEPGEPVELSYSLAEILLHLLAKNRQDFLAFIEAVDYDDAGQTAALDCLGTCIGEAVGTFLGPGNWRPQRKAIKECWAARQKQSGARGR
jgi:hypothetical protein